MLLRTSLFQQIGGFDPRYFMYFEDADLTRTIRKYAKLSVIPRYCIPCVGAGQRA